MKCRCFPVLFPFLLIVACAAAHVSKSDDSERYNFDSVPLRPGAAAWSPDSGKFAFIQHEELVLADYDSGMTKKIAGINPVFIDWSPGNDLIAVRKTGEGNELVRINAAEGTYYSIPTDHELEAARWFYPPDVLITFSKEVKRLQIGTFVKYYLARTVGDSNEINYEWEAYFPTRRQDVSFFDGWTFPGLRPLYETVLTPQYHNPPAAPPYTHLKTFDPVTVREEEIVRMESQRFNFPASWSPDGSRLAVTDDDGLLIIMDTENLTELMTVNDEVKGMFPSWNPRGSHIYLGGWLMLSDGTAVRELLNDGFDSVGVWSPDGRKLAVISGGSMSVFDSFTPVFVEPDRQTDDNFFEVRDKLRLLKTLLRDGLIFNSDFNIRRARILDSIRGDRK
jgi:WD40 repeat protein